MQRLVVTFRGRVQGVGFRYTTRQLARGFDVTGWVRNEPDGTVRLEVQGEPAEVESMVGVLRERMSGFLQGEQSGPMACVPGEAGFEIR